MSDKCPDCGAELYQSPSPSHAGKKEHFCSAVNGMVIEPGTTRVVSEPKPEKKKPTRSL